MVVYTLNWTLKSKTSSTRKPMKIDSAQPWKIIRPKSYKCVGLLRPMKHIYKVVFGFGLLSATFCSLIFRFSSLQRRKVDSNSMKTEKNTTIKSVIRNLKNGFGSMHRVKWVSTSGVYISIAGLVAVAGFVTSLIRDGKLCGKRETNSEKLRLVPGLQNLGNNCFLNVILQALASCTYFQSFLQKIVEEYENVPNEEHGESLPLAISLAALLEELFVVYEQRVVLSPHKVMLALSHYIQNFNLTSQQDADEAFFHLWSSLSSEFSDVYPSNQSSLADIMASSSCRILVSRMEGWNEVERWQQHLLGPFNGIISSILICQSCSSQISLEFQFFHSLPLSPALSFGSTTIAGCTLEDCLKKFVIAEQIENYRCNHCWHIGAVKYLSLVGTDKGGIEKLKRCNDEDSCDCRNLPNLASLPWSNKYSNTIKQLSIARCPKIMSINLKRVSVNMFGEPIKLQGHIVFPLILDLSPYMTSWVDTNNLDKEQIKQGQVKLQEQNASPMLDMNEIGCHSAESFTGVPNMAQIGCSSEATNIDSPLQNNKVSLACELAPSGTQMYRLVSVVEHFGRAGSGHYTVYRSLRVDSDKEDSNKNSDPNYLQWVCVSDSHVYNVSVDDVLAADASLLFYERM